MLRAFIPASRRILVPRPLPVYNVTSDAASCTANLDERRHSPLLEFRRPVLPLVQTAACGHPLLGHSTLLSDSVRHASMKKISIPDPATIVCTMINMLKCVDLRCLKEAPPPAFWICMSSSIIQVFIPLVEILAGYCHYATLLQLNLAAATVIAFGAERWGLATSKNALPEPTWDTATWIVIPSSIAIIGLLLPYSLGFPTVGVALIMCLYHDLKSCALAPWQMAKRLFQIGMTLVGIFLAWIAYLLFHKSEIDKEKERKEQEKKEKAKKKKNKNKYDDDDDDDDDE